MAGGKLAQKRILMCSSDIAFSLWTGWVLHTLRKRGRAECGILSSEKIRWLGVECETSSLLHFFEFYRIGTWLRSMRNNNILWLFFVLFPHIFNSQGDDGFAHWNSQHAVYWTACVSQRLASNQPLARPLLLGLVQRCCHSSEHVPSSCPTFHHIPSTIHAMVLYTWRVPLSCK